MVDTFERLAKRSGERSERVWMYRYRVMIRLLNGDFTTADLFASCGAAAYQFARASIADNSDLPSARLWAVNEVGGLSDASDRKYS
jgi:hypothetical protein